MVEQGRREEGQGGQQPHSRAQTVQPIDEVEGIAGEDQPEHGQRPVDPNGQLVVENGPHVQSALESHARGEDEAKKLPNGLE